MRESWVRLCGTYQSRGGILAQPEVRKVRVCVYLFLSLPFGMLIVILYSYRQCKTSPHYTLRFLLRELRLGIHWEIWCRLYSVVRLLGNLLDVFWLLRRGRGRGQWDWIEGWVRYTALYKNIVPLFHMHESTESLRGTIGPAQEYCNRVVWKSSMEKVQFWLAKKWKSIERNAR